MTFFGKAIVCGEPPTAKSIDVAFDMETADPDDLFTLIFLATTKQVSLRCVTVTPGARDQIWLVKRVLSELGMSWMPVGSADPENDSKRCVSSWYHKLYGEPSAEDLRLSLIHI